MTKSLRQGLSDEQRATLSHISTAMRSLWGAGDPINPLFTFHGELHIQNVERIIGELLGASQKRDWVSRLTPSEMFRLLAAAWLHDVGMFMPLRRDEQLVAGDNAGEWVRKRHHERTYQYIIDRADDLWLDKNDAPVVAEIAAAHRKIDLTRLDPSVRPLAALLRLSDELDITSRRAPDQFLQHYFAKMDRESKWHWLKHHCVTEAAPSYQLGDGPAGQQIHEVRYAVELRLPEEFAPAFWARVLGPIERVYRREHVDLSLETIGIRLNLNFSLRAYSPKEEPLPDGKTVREHLVEILQVDQLPDEVTGRLRTLEELIPPAADVLRKQYDAVWQASTTVPVFQSPLRRQIEIYSDRMSSSKDEKTAGRISTEFLEAVRPIVESITTHGAKKELWLKLRRFSDLSTRFQALAFGDATGRRRQLEYLRSLLGPKVNRIISFVAVRDADEGLRNEAVKMLRDIPSVESYRSLLLATTDVSRDVRISALQSLICFPGPRTICHLAAILEQEIDAQVKEVASGGLHSLGVDVPLTSHRYANSGVLILDSDNALTDPIYQAIGSRTAHVHKSPMIEDGISLARDLRPGVILLELCGQAVDNWERPYGANVEQLPGFGIARELRAQLGPATHLIATSRVRVDNTRPLADIGALYHWKPTSADELIASVRLLLPDDLA